MKSYHSLQIKEADISSYSSDRLGIKESQTFQR